MMATNANTVEPQPLEAPLPQDVLSHLYTNMLKARLLAKRWRKATQMSEAVLAATLQNTEPADLLVSAGSHPILAALSGTPLVELEPNKPDAAANKRHVVAGENAAPAIAAGLAMGLKNAGSSALVVAVLPSSLTHGTAWAQATEFAATHRLPVIFVSDGTASRPLRQHDGKELSHWPFPTIAVDGRDVIAVYRVTKEAMAAARRGHGPTLVDCVNFVAPGGRGKDERDPVASFRGYLKRHNAWSDDWGRQVETDLSRETLGK